MSFLLKKHYILTKATFYSKVMTRSLLLLASFLLLLVGCKPEPQVIPTPKTTKDYDASAIVRWNQQYLALERYAGGYRPGPAPRSLAYIGLAVYESCLSGMPDYRSVKGYYPGLTIPAPENGVVYYYPEVVNAAYGSLMKSFFAAIPTITASQMAEISALSSQLEAQYAKETDSGTFSKSRIYGEAVAKAVYEYAKTDAIAHDHHLDPFKDAVGKYKPSSAKGNWVPTIPGSARPMFPDWGYCRTFAIKETDRLCKNPIPYSEDKNSQFFNQASEVVAMTKNVTADQRWYAFFWSDDLMNLTFSPGPRWIAIANAAILQQKANLETAIYANVKVGMAINDAAVSCWYSKYYYNFERPESYIKRVIDLTWEPLLYNPLTGDKGMTPAFPAYPSGHSTMGAAAAEVLSDIFGNSVAITDRCHEGRYDFEGSNPRSFGSFYEMANENAYSRIPLGVHFRMDCEEGVNLGIRCGRKVNQLNWKR